MEFNSDWKLRALTALAPRGLGGCPICMVHGPAGWFTHDAMRVLIEKMVNSGTCKSGNANGSRFNIWKLPIKLGKVCQLHLRVLDNFHLVPPQLCTIYSYKLAVANYRIWLCRDNWLNVNSFDWL